MKHICSKPRQARAAASVGHHLAYRLCRQVGESPNHHLPESCCPVDTEIDRRKHKAAEYLNLRTQLMDGLWMASD